MMLGAYNGLHLTIAEPNAATWMQLRLGGPQHQLLQYLQVGGS
jgi:hypothetical protein